MGGGGKGVLSSLAGVLSLAGSAILSSGCHPKGMPSLAGGAMKGVLEKGGSVKGCHEGVLSVTKRAVRILLECILVSYCSNFYILFR